jgi:hypothetical protein
MATRIRTWQIVNGKLKSIDTTLADTGRKEALDLESWIATDSSILGPELAIIGRQVSTRSGPLDLLAIDRLGNLVIVELKRDLLPRAALMQAIDYASDLATWSLDKIGEVCASYTGKSLEEFMEETFPDIDLESISINETQRILLAGFSVESALERMISWLSSSFGVSVNAVILSYVKTEAGEELLTKTSIISEEIEQDRIKKRKIQMPMSDEPGSYDRAELREHLVRYLSQRRYRTMRLMVDVIIPILLERGSITRHELIQELLSREEAESSAAAGFILTWISRVFGLAKNDFLRQVIGYDYPNYDWEKDNYHLRSEYKDFMKEILVELHELRDQATKG